ncbi:MAG: hypothetical protein IT355_15665 [Gemmatimonadaceae bacterium]|nr:hypothetical protein [Gemmatimonadaceae bacterium]
MALPMQTVRSSGDGDLACAPNDVVAVESGWSVRATAQQSLEGLMRQALEVPGAATALLEAFAQQTRALRMVQEADARGAALLPADVRCRLADAAACTPAWLAVGSAGVRG